MEHVCVCVWLASQADSWGCVNTTGLFMPHVLSSSSQIKSVLVHFYFCCHLFDISQMWGCLRRFSSRGRPTQPPLSLCDITARSSVQRQTWKDNKYRRNSLGRCSHKHFHTGLPPPLVLVPHKGPLQLQWSLNIRFKNVEIILDYQPCLCLCCIIYISEV